MQLYSTEHILFCRNGNTNNKYFKNPIHSTRNIPTQKVCTQIILHPCICQLMCGEPNEKLSENIEEKEERKNEKNMK